MSKVYIELSDSNVKAVKNFIGMCRMNGLEGSAAPAFNFKDEREGLGTVSFDLYYDFRSFDNPCWKMTVKVDTEVKLDPKSPGTDGDQYSYLDNYAIKKDSLDLEYKNSRFNVFSY